MLLRLLLPLVLLSVAPAASAIGETKASFAGVAYLPAEDGVGVLRYDLATRVWLDPIPGAGPAYLRQIHVDESGIYLLYDDRVARLTDPSQPATPFWTGAPRELVGDADWLFLREAGVLRTLRKSDAAVVSELVLSGGTLVLGVAPAVRRIVLYRAGALATLEYGADGSLGEPVAARDGPRPTTALYPFPDGRRFVDGRGHVYDAGEDLGYLGSFPIDSFDATFVDGMLVAGRQLPCCSSDHVVAAFDGASRAELGQLGTFYFFPLFASHGRTLFVFDAWRPDPQVHTFDLDALTPPRPGAPQDPESHPHASFAAVTEDGIVYLRDGANLFRWSIPEARYLESLALVEAPQDIVYDAEEDALFLVYPHRLVSRIAGASGSTPVEAPFTVLANSREFGPAEVLGPWFLSAGGLYASDGELVQSNFPFATWALGAAPALGRLFAGIGGSAITSFRLDEQGQPVDLVEAPGPVTYSLRLLPSRDGTLLFDGAGIREGDTLTPLAPIATDRYSPAAWFGERLAVADSLERGGFVLRWWAPPYADPELEVESPGQVTGLFSFAGDLYLIRQRDGRRSIARLVPGDDTDGDGMASSEDAFPLDPAEIGDRDLDGYGDNEDAFPDHSGYHGDADGDRIPDPLDRYPTIPERTAAEMLVKYGVRGLRASSPLLLYADLHVFESGAFQLCLDESECLAGTWRQGRGRRLVLELASEALDALADRAEHSVESSLSFVKGRAIDVDLELRPGRGQLFAKVSRRGDRVRLEIRLPYVARSSDLAGGPMRGVFRIDGTAETWVRGAD